MILNDERKAYKKVREVSDLNHIIVNHSIHFQDLETLVHSNNVEDLNDCLKTQIKPGSRTKRV